MKTLLKIIIIALAMEWNDMRAQPANDNCASATALTVNAAPLCGQTTASSTIQAGETINQCGASGIDQSVWYKFTATQGNMDVWVDNLQSGGCYMGSVVYNTSACQPGAGNIISCKPNVSTGGIDYWHHLAGLTIGNTYLILIVYNAGMFCGSGQTFCVSVVAPTTAGGYTQPTSGMAGEFIGACMTTTCAGKFYDDGGAGANYSDNVNLIYRTFCPNALGQCIQAAVSYIDLEESFDYLYIENGPTQNSPSIAPCNPCYKTGNQTFTSTDASGCLTFRFKSDATNTYPGWNITLSCVPCAANTAADNNDCSEAIGICSNQSFTGASVGPGISSEGCSGCNTSEHFTNWYYFCAQTTGTLRFLIDPTVNTQDYDFALYGPGVTCGTLGTPVRCSYAANTNNTGLNSGSSGGDNTEDVSGNGWVNDLSVTAGQCFYLMVSQWSAGGSGFTVDFTGSTSSLDCSALPVELISFTADCDNGKVIARWETASEFNSDYFTLEKSTDGNNFSPIAKIKAAGISNTLKKYSAIDNDPSSGLSYYRLSETDYNGQIYFYDAIAINGCGKNSVNAFFEDNVLTVILNSRSAQSVQLFLYNVLGEIIASNEENISAGTNTVTENLAVSKGIYFIKIKTDEMVYSGKIIFR